MNQKPNFTVPAIVAILAICLFVIAGCSTEGQTIESDSGFTYQKNGLLNQRIPVDDTIYVLKGVVIANVSSIGTGTVRQDVANGANWYQPLTGVYFTPGGGKGFVRLYVISSTWDQAPAESVAILKSLDTKATALLPGDAVTFLCRAQAEPVAPSYTGQPYDSNAAITWELDFCRMLRPTIDTKTPKIVPLATPEAGGKAP